MVIEYRSRSVIKATLSLVCLVTLVTFSASAVLAQTTGRIDGTVVDAGTGDPLPGVNVVVVGTQQGAVSNAEGYYTIVGVRAGAYTLRASFIGYSEQTVDDVHVNVGLTTTINFQLTDEAVGLEEVYVTAERPIVQRDVSASVANITAQEIENLPVTDVERVIGLQAGFERGLTIRGSGGSQVAFQVDGMSMASGRDNTPFTGISYTAVQEIQVQTGGFNAEYGNVRAGLVNVITKDGDRNRYSADVVVRYSPPSHKFFSGYSEMGERVRLASDPNAYWVRPLFDENVAMEGTGNGAWDEWTRRQYREFVGWNELATQFGQNTDGNPETDVTARQMQEAFRWYLRKDFSPQRPDYEIDGTIGGPIPGGQSLGDLRFTASYRQTQGAYAIPYVRDHYDDRTFQGKLTSDVGPGMRLHIQSLYAEQSGMNNDGQGWPNLITGEMPAYPWDGRSVSVVNHVGGDWGGQLFSMWRMNLMDVDRLMVGTQFTHAVSNNTFYEIQLERMTTDYFTRPTRAADHSPVVCFVQTDGGEILRLDAHPEMGCNTPEIQGYPGGVIALDEAIVGYEWRDTFDAFGTGLRTGGHWGSGHDTSSVVRWRGKLDVTSQLNRYSQLKAGLEYVYSDYDTKYGQIDPGHPHHANPVFIWRRQPNQGALYAQNKLEFQGMVANIGLRLDYFRAGGDWYDYPPFTRVLSAQFGRERLDDPDAVDREDWGLSPTEHQFSLSPRLGVSYPITDNSKLYFNYGHFRQMLNPVDLFTIQEINTGAVQLIGNPNHPMPRTTMYELGYEQNIFDQFLLRLAGYYRDLHYQPRSVWYQSIDGEVAYSARHPWNYGDVRGFEITLMKNRGDWIRGFVNYTYMASKSGNFGYSNIYENRVQQRQFLLTSTDHYQSKPIPEPYARFNIEVLLPRDLGPETGGRYLLGDWRINFLGEWRMGQSLTWTGNQLVTGRSPVRGLQGNTRWRDYYNVDMRFSKNFDTALGGIQFFADVTNVLNIRHMHRFNAWEGDRDEEFYLRSLHFPEETFEALSAGAPYAYIPGNDKPGDFRKPGVAFVPIVIGALPEAGHERPLYYVPNGNGGGNYHQWDGSAFRPADQSFVDQVLKDKAYIDMPNEVYRTFLNPRNVFFGLRISL